MSFLGSVAGLASSALGKVGGFLSNYGGAVGSAAGSLLGETGWLSYSSAKSLNKRTLEQQLAASKELALNAPTWNVEGLRNAGINPILAATNGNLGNVNLPNGSIGSSGNLSVPNFQLVRKELDNLEAQKANLLAQNDLINAQSAKTKSEKENIDIKNRIQENPIGHYIAQAVNSYDQISNALRFVNSSKGAQTLKDLKDGFSKALKVFSSDKPSKPKRKTRLLNTPTRKRTSSATSAKQSSLTYDPTPAFDPRFRGWRPL